ncbi:MAG TPA: PEP-CTERM sorting domain-containing protein [Candidatus Krumholzibacteria bacterium]|nr:PEP-CTERM sorting domain-containing protein [Candidatus Krumholzibacteria bacterium]
MKTLLMLLAVAALAAPASALTYDQNVTPDVIFGSGNINGSFTVDVAQSPVGVVELGLRGKLRFDASNLPQNIFNSNGDGSYTFLAGFPTGGAGWAGPTTPYWNFEWSVNVDQDGGSGLTLDDFTYELGLDFDPSPGGTNYLVFDPITPSVSVPAWDHAIGDNLGTVVSNTNPVVYASNLNTYNVAQNSWSYEFFNDGPFASFDPTDDGVYEIYLKAFDASGSEVAHTAISIVVGNAVGNEDATFSAVKTLFR